MGSAPEGQNKGKKRQKKEEASVQITLHKEGEVENTQGEIGSSQAGLRVYEEQGIGKGEKVFIQKRRENGKVTWRGNKRGHL